MMRTFQQQRNYERLEQLPPQLDQLTASSFRWVWEVLSNLWQLPSSEPKVRQKMDSSGTLYWQAYDPLHHLTIRFEDEQAVMEWLDRQIYRRSRANLWNIDG